MALYTPLAQRRRRLVLVAVAALLLGAVAGAVVGRLTAPTPEQRVAQVQEQARQMSAQLRVLSLHAEAGAASLGSDGDAGSTLALHRTDGELADALQQAPWITPQQGSALRDRLHELERTANTDVATASFATDADQLATDIDRAFGVP